MKINKLAFFMPSLAGGGAQRVMITLVNGFAERGYDVDLVVADKNGPYFDSISPNVRLVDLAAKRTAFALLGLISYIRTQRPAVIVSALNHANVVALIAKALSFRKPRVIVSVHNAFTAAQSVDRGRARLVPLLVKLLYRWADDVVAVSEGVAKDINLNVRVPRVKVIYNPIDVHGTSDGDDLLLSYLDRPYILTVGRLSPQKDHRTLILAYGNLDCATRPRLIILGDGELRSELTQLVQDLNLGEDVIFPGFRSNPFCWMRKARLFVLSSRWEGLSMVLVEAMACGAPIVSTDCPSGPSEILEGGRWGRLVPVGSADSLTQAMQSSLSDVDLPDVKIRAEYFSVTRALDGYSEVIENGFQ